jgi:TM2 domain-containing membrane protein YozV
MQGMAPALTYGTTESEPLPYGAETLRAQGIGPSPTRGMTESQRRSFSAEMSRVQRSETVGVLLALLLGGLGAHHFYLARRWQGVRYLAICWTFIPAIIGLVEAFFMPARVRAFNAEKGKLIAASVLYSTEAD